MDLFFSWIWNLEQKEVHDRIWLWIENLWDSSGGKISIVSYFIIFLLLLCCFIDSMKLPTVYDMSYLWCYSFVICLRFPWEREIWFMQGKVSRLYYDSNLLNCWYHIRYFSLQLQASGGAFHSFIKTKFWFYVFWVSVVGVSILVVTVVSFSRRWPFT